MAKDDLLVFIVEDDAVWSCVLKGMLEKSGFKVAGIASSYDEAVAALRLVNPDLIFLDINLGTGKSGIDVASYINKHLQVPFIFLSSESDTFTVKSLMDTRPLDFLSKPVSRDRLLSCLGMLSPSFEADVPMNVTST